MFNNTEIKMEGESHLRSQSPNDQEGPHPNSAHSADDAFLLLRVYKKDKKTWCQEGTVKFLTEVSSITW